MNQDLDIYQNGELAPYSPGGDLQPISPDNDGWGDLSPDYLAERPASPQLQDPQAAEAFKEIGIVIAADLQRLNHPAKSISAAQAWYAANMGKEPRKERISHRYNLHDMQSDVMANNFANAMARAGASQEFVSNVLWLLGEAVKRLTGNAVAQGRAPSTENLENQLSDSQWEAVVVANEQARANTLGRLKDMWGSSFDANMRVVQNHFASLTDAEQAHLSQYTGNWIKGTNTFEIVTSLYAQAVQAHTIPRSGAAIAQEIQNIERYMKENRAAYFKDDLTQARYRELLNLQSGGR